MLLYILTVFSRLLFIVCYSKHYGICLFFVKGEKIPGCYKFEAVVTTYEMILSEYNGFLFLLKSRVLLNCLLGVFAKFFTISSELTLPPDSDCLILVIKLIGVVSALLLKDLLWCSGLLNEIEKACRFWQFFESLRTLSTTSYLVIFDLRQSPLILCLLWTCSTAHVF